MQFTISRGLLLGNPNSVMHAVSSCAIIPILNGIKPNLADETLTLASSDTGTSVEIQIPVSDDLVVQSTGSIVLPACSFGEVARKLPGKDFSFEIEENLQTKIVPENIEFMVNGLDTNSYPHLPEISADASFKISSKTFREIISETVFAVTIRKSCPTLTGVNFIFNNSSIKAVVTDSHRLSQRQVSLENGSQASTDLIIPGESLVELARVIGEDDPEITVNLGGNQVLFEVRNIAFYSRLLNGRYPDTDRLIPAESITSVGFELPVLARSLKRTSLLTHESRNNVVKMTSDVQDQLVKLQGDSPEIGNVREEINFKRLKGEGLTASFNPDYLREALHASIADSIIMDFAQPLRPFTVVPTKQNVNFT